MRAIEIARKLSGYGQTEEACKAYVLAVHEEGCDPAEKMEGAMYILQFQGDYQVAYDCFLGLYREGHYREDCLNILTEAFYLPNVKELRGRYERNRKALGRYPYLFRRDFPAFEELPIRFYPYDERRYVPFYVEEGRFGEPVDFGYPVVGRNFFWQLEKPILAEDVFSQYELEYLNDNVRRSEWVGRENHIYLHYTDWGVFCAHLQALHFKRLLGEEKLVFLIEDEVGQYPIDFKERFGLDYSQYPVKPVGIREVNRIIWHTQLSTHNGGDFFNEIYDGHPNLLYLSSVMMDSMADGIRDLRALMEGVSSADEAVALLDHWTNPQLVRELYRLRNRTDKDYLVAIYLEEKTWSPFRDVDSRVAPAIFFQPHFSNIVYDLKIYDDDRTVLHAKASDEIREAAFLRQFPYIKTFTPLRRFTTSYAATLRFMYGWSLRPRKEGEEPTVVPDLLSQRVLNRSFMLDPRDRLYQDSVLVRFEDGKLNPKATFTALTAFLDLPYTESVTYCSIQGVRDATTLGNVTGFDTATVYRTYDEYANDDERYFLEYFLRDAYEYYGYDFHYYDGAPVDEEELRQLNTKFTILNEYIRKTWPPALHEKLAEKEEPPSEEEAKMIVETMVEQQVKGYEENRMKNMLVLQRGLRFVNQEGEPLRMMPMLELDPELLEQPLYH